MSLWRNRLARSTVNRKVGGSSPPRDDLLFIGVNDNDSQSDRQTDRQTKKTTIEVVQ